MDLLYAHDGRTLNELCEHLDMTRQGVTQHLDVLEAANLIATVRRGREIVEAEPPRRLVIRWQNKFKPELEVEGESLCTMEREPIISNLKSLLETGAVALRDPYPVEST
jgi:DNA-binding transcriptional ArsR family regulator